MGKRYIVLILAALLLLGALLWLLLRKAPPADGEGTAAPTQPVTAPTQTTTVPTQPTTAPTQAVTDPTEETQPTVPETQPPTQLTDPTTQPTAAPTQKPTQKPTQAPTRKPTAAPTQAPTEKPTRRPTQAATSAPTEAPTAAPTQKPTQPASATQTLKINTKSFTTIFVGDTLQIDYTYSGDKSELTWSSDDTSILTVNSKGIVTGKAAGIASVIISDDSITKVVSIIVSDAPKATSLKKISFNAPLYDGVVKYAGDYMTFEVYAMPEESNRHCVVTSSNSSVVSVSYDYDYSNITQVTLNFKSAGTAKVIITSADGNVSESYNITVKADYACNPGSGLLTPEQFVNAYNGVVSANGLDSSYAVSGYLVLNLSESDLTFDTARMHAEGDFHHWYAVGKKHLSITYEGTNADGKHVFYVHRYLRISSLPRS